ncbi:unnamed protein product [Rhizophagus irregularis]|nr:unnamed protein product [Rhizophagus irregularis]
MYRKRLFNFQFTPSEIHIQKNNNNNDCTKRGRLPIFNSLLYATCATTCASLPKNYHKGKSLVVVPPELILDTTPLRHHTRIKDKVPQVAKRSISERLDEFKKKAYDFESVRAAKNGPSVKKLRLRDIQKQSLTDINDAFHEHMSEFRKRARRTTAPLHPK